MQSPKAPLQALSPNRQSAMPRSPSISLQMCEDVTFTSPARNSEVAERVQQFNKMNKDFTSKQSLSEAALRRAVIGREEAESESKKLRRENQVLQADLEERKARETKVSQRLESLMEEMQQLRETEKHKQMVYEKEVRKARKEAFKTSSVLLKMQEDLKTTRNRFTLMREEVEVQKRKTEMREKEILSGQIQQITIQEELGVLKQKIRQVEEERNVLRTSLREEEVARIAAEGRIPLPPCSPDAAVDTPRMTNRTSQHNGEEHTENLFTTILSSDELELLRKNLGNEKEKHRQTAELVDAMKLECQLKICSCRRAERINKPYTFIKELEITEEDEDAKETQFTGDTIVPPNGPESIDGFVEPTAAYSIPTNLRKAEQSALLETRREARNSVSVDIETNQATHPTKEVIEYSPKSGTFRRISLMVNETTKSPSPCIHSTGNPGIAHLPPLQLAISSDSPSIISLDQESQSLDESSRLSGECSMFIPNSPRIHPTPSTSFPAGSFSVPSKLASPTDAINFPPTPGADLTLTAPIDLSFRVSTAVVPNSNSPGRWPVSSNTTEPMRYVEHSNFELETTQPTAISYYPSLESSEDGISRRKSPSTNQHTGDLNRLVETHVTTTVPLAGDPSGSKRFPYSPGASKTREEALESIQRWRAGRHRARSALGHNESSSSFKCSADQKRDITR